MNTFNGHYTEDSKELMETLNKAIVAFTKLLDKLGNKQISGVKLLEDADLKEIDPDRL